MEQVPGGKKSVVIERIIESSAAQACKQSCPQNLVDSHWWNYKISEEGKINFNTFEFFITCKRDMEKRWIE